MTDRTTDTQTLNASEYTFGRLASRAAFLLQGKHRPDFAPNRVGTTTVVVRNLERVRFTGTKLTTTHVHRFTGYPGGIKSETLRESFRRRPKPLFRNAVARMLPKNRLVEKRLKNLVIL